MRQEAMSSGTALPRTGRQGCQLGAMASAPLPRTHVSTQGRPPFVSCFPDLQGKYLERHAGPKTVPRVEGGGAGAPGKWVRPSEPDRAATTARPRGENRTPGPGLTCQAKEGTRTLEHPQVALPQLEMSAATEGRHGDG